MERLVRWDQHSLTNYTHLRTKKGYLNQWRHKIKRVPSAMCRFCEVAEETEDHITFHFVKVEDPQSPIPAVPPKVTHRKGIRGRAVVVHGVPTHR